MFKKITALLLAFALVFIMQTPGFANEKAENESLKELFSAYLKTSVSLENDGYIGIPVDINVYAKNETDQMTQMIFYIINSSEKRVGTESDNTIIADFLDEGYIVVTLDYKNSPLAVSPSIDWSIQNIRIKMDEGNLYLNGLKHRRFYDYVVPAGCRLERDVFYWSLAEHGVNGIEDELVKIWNSDGFKNVYGEKLITYADGTQTKVKDVVATDFSDLVKPDGTPLDMDLKMDIIYPSQPKEDVPVMMLASSAETRISTWSHDSIRPHMTGFLMQGYAGVIYDYCYAPMGRDDHYGWWAGCELGVKMASLYNTAAVRKLRLMSYKNHEKYKFDNNRFGAMGHSKSGIAYVLGSPEPQNVVNKYFDGINDTTKNEQPWLIYPDGNEISSRVSAVYSSAGGDLSYFMTDDYAPSFFAAGKKDWGSWNGSMPGMAMEARKRNLQSMYFTMEDYGHTLITGYNKELDCDMYQAYFDFMNYYVKGEGAAVTYIKPTDNSKSVPVDTEIEIKFSGAVLQNEIEKNVSITNAATGEELFGKWRSEFGGTSWYFKSANMKNSAVYKINVKETLKCKNGKNIKSSKQTSFSTVWGAENEAERVLGEIDENNLVNVSKSSDGAKNAYIKFAPVDYKNYSSAEEIKFNVVNDGAQRVKIYALKDYNEENPQQSTLGKELAVVPINGAGVYSADVSEYTQSLGANESAAFMLCSESETADNKLINSITFDDLSSYTSANYFTEGKPDSANYMCLSDLDHTTGSGKSFVMKNTTADYVKMRNVIKNGYLTEEDLGRKFHVECFVYSTGDCSVRTLFEPPYYGSSNPLSEYVDFEPAGSGYVPLKANTWEKREFDWRCDTPEKANSALRHGLLSVQAAGDHVKNPLYIDDIKVYETVTPAMIAAKTNKSENVSAPSIVMHPKKIDVFSAADESYVESGINENVSFEDALFGVNGRKYVPSNGGNKKTYVKLDIKDVSDVNRAEFKFKVTNDVRQNILVYGVDRTKLTNYDWNSESINQFNAPANDRYSPGVDLSKVFGAAALDSVKVNGAGEYSADVTDYVNEMAQNGFEYATIILVADLYNGKIAAAENFDGETQSLSFKAGGGGGSGEITASADHTTGHGKCYVFQTQYGYSRRKIDVVDFKNLTEADKGRKFKMTFFAKANAAGTFTVGMQSYSDYSSSEQTGSNKFYNRKDLTLNEANVWQKFEYEFELDDYILDPKFDAEKTRPGYVSFMLNKLGARANGGVVDIDMYFDDITVEEIGVSGAKIEPVEGSGSGGEASGYKMNLSFDDLDSSAFVKMSPSGIRGYASEYNEENIIWIGNSWDTGGSQVGMSLYDDDRSGKTNGKCAKMTIPEGGSKYSGGRYKFYNIVDHPLTSEDLGRQFKVSFYLKSPEPGTVRVCLQSARSSVDQMDTNQSMQESKVSITKANEWQRFTKVFTIDEKILDSKYDNSPEGYSNRPALLSFRMFQKEYDANAVGTVLYIDDITSKEVTENESVSLSAADIKTVSDSGQISEGYFAEHEQRNDTLNKIGKVYVRFDGGDFASTRKATLKFNVENAFDGKIKIYAIKNYNSADALTYLNAPANAADEGMLLSGVYGAAPIAEVDVKSPDEYAVDVSGYIKENSPDDYVFAFASEQTGGYETFNSEAFLKENFMKNSCEKTGNVNISADDSGKLIVSDIENAADGVKIKNVFANDAFSPSDVGRTFSIKADVLLSANADSDCKLKLSVCGESSDDENGAAIINLFSNTQTNIEYSITVTEDMVGKNMIKICQDGESAANKIAIENLTVSENFGAVLEKNSFALEIESEKNTEPKTDEKTAKITLYTTGDAIMIDGEILSSSLTCDIAVGKTITLKSIGDQTFMYWKDMSSGRIISYDEEFNFTVGTNREIAAIYAPKDSVYITFKNINDAVSAEGEADLLTTPQNPYLYGYEFAGWYTDGKKTDLKAGDKITVGKNTVYTAGFVKNPKQYTITVDGSENKYFYNDMVSVNAKTDKDGKIFAYWMRDGQIVSYDAQYSFYVSSSSELVSVYGENAENKSILTAANPVMAEDTKIAFFAERNIKADYKIIETGMLLGKTENLSLETNGVIKAAAKNTKNTGQFTIRKANVKSGETWYAKAYAICKDENENIVTLYSNEVYMSVK